MTDMDFSTGTRQVEPDGPRATPDLVGGFRAFGTTAPDWTPMTSERRTELIGELLEWADDPQSADWESIKKLS